MREELESVEGVAPLLESSTVLYTSQMKDFHSGYHS